MLQLTVNSLLFNNVQDALQEVEGIVRRKYKNGDLLFVEKEGRKRLVSPGHGSISDRYLL